MAYAFIIVPQSETRFGFSRRETRQLALHEKPAMLIDAAHHPREMTTVSMCFYTMIRLLHGYVHQD